MKLYFLPLPASHRDNNHDGTIIGHLLDSKNHPWWAVHRHRDGMLVCWSYDMPDAIRVVTDTKHINCLSNYLPDVDTVVDRTVLDPA